VGLAALEDTEALHERVKFNNSQVQFIQDALADVPGLTIFPSHGNYILFDCGKAGKRGEDMVAFAQERGLIFRPQPKMYASEGFFRLTVGTEQENKEAVEAIRAFMAG
jgi:histidinol-phosphate/aromatic aminotransferase/cobyric acid decarboxylase-like protein